MQNDLNSDLDYPKCNLCSSAEVEILFLPKKTNESLIKYFSASQGILGAQRIVRCKQCNLVYVSPRIKSSTIIDAYSTSVDDLYVSQAETRISTFRRSTKLLSQYASPPGNLLDVGAAAGFFCKAAQDTGWNVIGVEPSSWMAQWGKGKFGVDLRQGTLQDHKFNDSFFNVITMWDSIEHMPDPLISLKECHRIMKSGGILLINTPDFGSFLARIFGQNWWFLLSHHLYYFTSDTINKMLEVAGFEVIDIRRHYQFLELVHLAKMIGLYSKSMSRAALTVFEILHLGKISIPYYASQMNIIARKRVGGK